MHVKGLMRLASYLRDRFSLNSDSGKAPLDIALEPAHFDQGLYVQSVIEALRKSSDTRQWVKVEIDNFILKEFLDCFFIIWSGHYNKIFNCKCN